MSENYLYKCLLVIPSIDLMTKWNYSVSIYADRLQPSKQSNCRRVKSNDLVVQFCSAGPIWAPLIPEQGISPSLEAYSLWL